MVSLKKGCFVLILILFLPGSTFALGGQESSTGKQKNAAGVSFDLAAGIISGSTINDSITANHKLTFFLRLYKPACLYLLLFSSGDEVVWIKKQEFLSASGSNQEYFFPDQDFWDKKRAPGNYQFCLYISAKHIKELDAIINSPAADTRKVKMHLSYEYAQCHEKSNQAELPVIITGTVFNEQTAGSVLSLDNIRQTSDRSQLQQELLKNTNPFRDVACFMQMFEVVFNE